MVFGNMGGRSGTGVAFTRNPSTARSNFYGEYLLNAQGEDVVAGIRTPIRSATQEGTAAVYTQFASIAALLESITATCRTCEFTIERGKLWMLQTRTGKRSGAAAVRIAVDMAQEKVIDRATASQRVSSRTNRSTPAPDRRSKNKCARSGDRLPRARRRAGQVVFSPDEAEELAREGATGRSGAPGNESR
jgi:pyruvate,orthophosphate dikinase